MWYPRSFMSYEVGEDLNTSLKIIKSNLEHVSSSEVWNTQVKYESFSKLKIILCMKDELGCTLKLCFGGISVHSFQNEWGQELGSAWKQAAGGRVLLFCWKWKWICFY